MSLVYQIQNEPKKNVSENNICDAVIKPNIIEQDTLISL